eukprot:scaffold36396_cov32-Tisochrysis_lutea.AAC.1
MHLKRLIFPHAPAEYLDFYKCQALRQQYNFNHGNTPSSSSPVALVTVGAPVSFQRGTSKCQRPPILLARFRLMPIRMVLVVASLPHAFTSAALVVGRYRPSW